MTNLVVCRVQLESKDSAVEIADDEITMSCSVSGCPGQAGSTVTVGVTGEFQLITPILSFVFGGQTLPMAASATAQREYLPTPNTETLPPPPVAEFTWSVSGKTVSFNGGPSSGDPTGWSWDFGDGNFDNTQRRDHDPHLRLRRHLYRQADRRQPRRRGLGYAHDQRRDAESESVWLVRADGQPLTLPDAVQLLPAQRHRANPATAQADLINAGFSVITYADLTNGGKNKIQAQNPDHTQCLAAGTQISIHYRPN